MTKCLWTGKLSSRSAVPSFGQGMDSPCLPWTLTLLPKLVLRALLCTPFLAALLPSTATAWGREGHQLIAHLAAAQLTPIALRAVDQLLALEPGATLASISTWADETRSPSTAAWHYVNLPRASSCTYDAARDCAGGRCVVTAIESQLAILRSARANDQKRLTALKYVVHLVGDVHQPLNAGFADDRGGNSYQLQAFGRGTNLHALWDSVLLVRRNEDHEDALARLRLLPVPSAERSASMATAVQQACRIVSEPSFYPARKLPDDYVAQHAPVLDRQLAFAGARLAEILNRTFE